MIVVQDQDHPLLLSGAFEVEAPHWLADGLPESFECGVKTRYRQPDLPCSVARAGPGRLRVTLEQPARAVTPGQYAVFYQGEQCLGGGVIANRCSAAGAVRAPGISYNVEFSAEGS